MFFQSERVINKKILGEKSIKLIEDPESYYQYVKRLKKKRDEINNKKNLEKQIPGNGFLWNNKPKKYNLNYDYTKHENVKNITLKLNKNRSSSYFQVKPKNNFNKDKRFCYNKNLKNESLNLNEIFNVLYKKNENQKSKIESYNSNRNNLIKISQPIEFGNALDYLHKELYSLDLNSI